MRTRLAALRDLWRRTYPCADCGKPFDSPEERLLHAAFTECYGESS